MDIEERQEQDKIKQDETSEIETRAYDKSDQYHRVLKLTSPQMAGNDVKRVQRRLNVYQYSAGTEDGYFGPNTKAALERFQRENGLAVDGMCGPATWKKLIDNGGKNVWVRRNVKGNYIVCSIKTTPVIQIKNNAAVGKCLSQNKLGSRYIAEAVKARFKEVYGRDFTVKTDSVALEILGHYYPDKVLKALISLGGPSQLIKFLEGIKGSTTITDCGEKGYDNNRSLWDAGAPIYTAIANFIG